MSVSTNDIKKKITATENMSKITKAMQMVSVAKLGKTEHKAQHFSDYFSALSEVLAGMKHLPVIAEHPFITGRSNKKNKRIGVVLITTNRGLVGGYNNNLYKRLKDGSGFNSELFQIASDKQASGEDFKFYVVGQKGISFSKNELPQEQTQHFLFTDELSYSDILPLGSLLIHDFLNGEIDEVVLLYQDYLSKLSQEATEKILLPIGIDEIAVNPKAVDYEILPSVGEVCDSLLVQFVTTRLYDVFVTANLSEHAARMNAMSNATDNAEDIIKESKLLYNRARQAAITQELNEIVAGANAVN